MHKRLKPVLAFVLSLFMSVSTLSNTYTVFAEDEITQEETNTVDETTTDGTETDDTETEDTETEETNTVDETVDENTDTNVEEQMGNSNMMEYFLVDSPVVSSQETENFVLSLNNIEGYSNFRITIQKEDGTTLDLESSETVGNLVKFSNVFSNKGEYQVTSLLFHPLLLNRPLLLFQDVSSQFQRCVTIRLYQARILRTRHMALLNGLYLHRLHRLREQQRYP